MTKKSESSISTPKCYYCDKPAVTARGEILLCVDCYLKFAYADFLEAQAENNRLSWLASQFNLGQQDLHIAMGGILPLKQMMIPQPPNAPTYLSQQIKVSESNIGVVNTGTLSSLETSIQVIQNRGDKELANAVTKLTEAVVNSTEINNELKRETAEQLDFLLTEAFASKEKQRKDLARRTMSDISQSIGTIAGLLTIWSTVQPLLQACFGM
jgi:hypothetical protein